MELYHAIFGQQVHEVCSLMKENLGICLLKLDPKKFG